MSKSALLAAIKEHDVKFSKVEFEIFRTMAITSRQEKIYSHSTYYYAMAIDKLIVLNEGVLLRAIADQMANDLKELPVKEVHQLENVKAIIKKLPSTLSIEKEKIEALLKDCKEYKQNPTAP